MADKKFILTAEGLGVSDASDRAILEGCQEGFAKSVCIVANGNDFDNAINNILPNLQNLGVSTGLCLNIIDGKPLCGDITSLIDKNGNFNNSFMNLIIKAYNPKEKDFWNDIEREFRRQIEKTLSKTKITHLSSANNIHSIPKIFELTCRLAKEYQIPYIRTYFEKPYFMPDIGKHFRFNYIINFLKSIFFGMLTIFNESTAHNYELKTNDYFIGIAFERKTTPLSLVYGAGAIKYKNVIIEASICPNRYSDGQVDDNFTEFLLMKNKKLKEKIENLGYEITNYAEKEN